MPTSIFVPNFSLRAANSAIGGFLSAFAPYWDSEGSVNLDFTNCTFLSSEGAAIVASFKLCRDAHSRVTLIDVPTVRQPVWKQLGRWGICPLFGCDGHKWLGNAIPLLHQTELDSDKLYVYTSSHIEPAGRNMPRMSPALTKKVRSEINELFANVFEHSESPCGGLVIGQFYPNDKTVQLCVADAGVGLVNRVRQSGCGITCPKAAIAIAWALGGHSTRDKAGVPGGLGLKLLVEFVTLNRGELRILANDGIYRKTWRTDSYDMLSTPLPGTLLQLSLNVRENEAYALTSEQPQGAA